VKSSSLRTNQFRLLYTPTISASLPIACARFCGKS
jgi:peroxiredoxin